MKYVINFFCDVDFTVDAESPKEARAKAENLLGKEIQNEKMEYVYISDINNIVDENGGEVRLTCCK